MHQPRLRRTSACDERGFALSEMVLVLVFVAGLLIVISVSVGNIRGETATSNCQSDLRTLKLAVQQYQAQNDAYPTDKAELIADGLVEAGDIRRWSIAADGDGVAEPAYVPVDDACS